MAPDRSDWHWEDVKAAVRKRGATLSGLSIDLGFSNAAVRQVKFYSIPRVQAGIARFLGVNPIVIWPSRYDETGKPVRGRRSDANQSRPRRPAAEPQKQKTL